MEENTPKQQNNTEKKEQMATPQTNGGNGGLLYGIIAIIILLILGSAYFYLSEGMPGDQEQSENAEEEIDDTVTSDVPNPVAVVNDEEISSDEYNAALAQIRTAGGGQLDEAELQQRALDTLINNTLLSQEITESGITADSTEVDAQIETLIEQTGGQSAFNEQLAAVNLTLDEVRAQIAEQLAAEAYISENVDLESATVTEEDVNAFYEQLAAQNENIGELAEVRDQIEAQLTAQAQQTLVQQYLETLRAAATVEIFLE